MTLFTEISKSLENNLKSLGFDQTIEVKFSDFTKEYDVQINNLVSARKLDNYDLIKAKVAQSLASNNYIENYEISDSGFINIELNESYLKFLLNNHLKNLNSKVKEKNKTVMFDFGGANIGKSLHVGHIRTLNIGRSLKNIYNLAGYKTISDIHFGDWGMPVAQIIAFIEKNEIKLEKLKAVDLEVIYPEAAKLAKENKEFHIKVKHISKELNNQNDEYIKKWKIIYDISTQNIIHLLNELGFEFDIYKGESDVVKIIPKFIEKLKSKNLISLDEGAYVASDNQDPPAIVVKSDGAYVYLTTDLATVIDRETQYSADKYVYIVDQRQKKHFEQLFELVKFFSLSNKTFIHIGFGTINNKEGKPLKTREGGNYKLEDLYLDVKNKLNEKNETTKNLDMLAKSVLTYSDLVTNRLSNYKFDIDKFTNINGKSAIYIQYSNVRAKKLINNYEGDPVFSKFSSNERMLAIEILKFKYYFDLSLKNNEPHHLAEYAYKLCQEFNSFYKSNKIFKEDNTPDKISHLMYIVDAFYETLLTIFECLGLQPVESM